MNYKSMYKSELARAAGVSSDTFRRWLQSDRAGYANIEVGNYNDWIPLTTLERIFVTNFTNICDKKPWKKCHYFQENPLKS